MIFLLFEGLRYLQTRQKDPLWNVLYRILWFEQEVEWCHWQGRIVLRDFKLNLVIFLYASTALSLGVVQDMPCFEDQHHQSRKTLLHWHPMATGAGRLYIEYSLYFCTQLFECVFLSQTSFIVVLQYQKQDSCLIHFHESLQTVFFNESLQNPKTKMHLHHRSEITIILMRFLICPLSFIKIAASD